MAVDPYWISASQEDGTPHLNVEGCFLAVAPAETHIETSPGAVVIRNVTMFAGTLTHWGAIRWGCLGLLRLGPLRVRRIRRVIRRVAAPAIWVGSRLLSRRMTGDR